LASLVKSVSEILCIACLHSAESSHPESVSESEDFYDEFPSFVSFAQSSTLESDFFLPATRELSDL
jgi:hypothetical protein